MFFRMQSKDNFFCYVTLVCLSAFLAWGMHFELYVPEIHMSDGAFHLSVLKALEEAFSNGRNPFDFWYAGTPFGFALFRSYQSLPYLIMFGAYLLLGKMVSLAVILIISNILLVMLVPWSIFISCRLFGFSILQATGSALASALFSDSGEFGFGLQLYTFGNNGLFTQLWALVFLPLALSLSYRFILDGIYLRSALLLSFLTFGSHVICAFILLFSLGVLFVIQLYHRNLVQLKRALIFIFVLALCTSYQWIFAFLDAPYINQSLLEPAWKYEGRGIKYVLDLIWSGSALDSGRFPTLTILFLIGFVSALYGYGSANLRTRFFQRYAGICAVLFISLYAGREIWGWIFTDTPGLKSLHIHRFAIGFHLFTIYLIGIATSIIIEKLFKNKYIGIFILLVGISPLIQERYSMYRHAGTNRINTYNFLENNHTAFNVTKDLEPGIVYAGNQYNWQKETSQFGIPIHFFTTGAGTPTVGGALYHAFALSGETLFEFNISRKAHFSLYGIKQVIAPSSWSGLPGFSKVKEYTDIALWKTDTGMLSMGSLYFSLCGNKKLASNSIRNWDRTNLVELGQFGILTSQPCGSVSDIKEVSYLDAIPIAKAQYERGVVLSEAPYTPWKIEGRVAAKKDEIVVLATSFHPNWKALIDGVQVPTLWVTPGFIAAKVPEGEHNIVFEYEGSLIKAILFLLGIGIMFGLRSFRVYS